MTVFHTPVDFAAWQFRFKANDLMDQVLVKGERIVEMCLSYEIRLTHPEIQIEEISLQANERDPWLELRLKDPLGGECSTDFRLEVGDGDWIVKDPYSEGNYKVMTTSDLKKFIATT